VRGERERDNMIEYKRTHDTKTSSNTDEVSGKMLVCPRGLEPPISGFGALRPGVIRRVSCSWK
jgi:hypothetical protein